MKVTAHFQQELARRLEKSEAVVIYDPQGRWQAAVVELASTLKDCEVVLVEKSTLLGREAVGEAWRRLGAARRGVRSLLVWLPLAKPLTDEAKQQDPFSAWAAASQVFPDGDGDGYRALCFAAKPEHRAQLGRLFQGSEPDLAAVEALDSGSTYPRLKSMLKVDSMREILCALVFPDPMQKSRLENDGKWVDEFRELAGAILNYIPKAGLTNWDGLRRELARFILFSEFCFDLRETLPESLQGVLKAKPEIKDLVFALGNDFRESRKWVEDYKDLANTIAVELDLPNQCKAIKAFGRRETFLFEDWAFRHQLRSLLIDGKLEDAESLLRDREHSIWAEEPDIAVHWTWLRRSYDLAKKLQEAPTVPPGLKGLLQDYQAHGWRVDRAHRVWEQTLLEVLDREAESELEKTLRSAWQAWADKTQKSFFAAAQQEGWPSANLPRHTALFKTWIAPELDARNRVAMVWVDAWRYEMAAEWADTLKGRFPVEFKAVQGQLPSVTSVGMAALLPDAESLRLEWVDEELKVHLGGAIVHSLADRLAFLKSRYGDRFQQIGLDNLLQAGTASVPATVQLLVVNTTEIDTAGENETPNALGVMAGTQRRFLQVVHKLTSLGFNKAYFVTDHGFLLLGQDTLGDKVEKPKGKWGMDKVRCMVGSGASGGGAAIFDPALVGIATSANQVALPRTLGTFRAGERFMHSGLSLQECLLPVLAVNLTRTTAVTNAKAEIKLSYRAQAITSRRVSIRVESVVDQGQENLFQASIETPLFLEARTEDGLHVVGRPGPSAKLDAGTGMLRIHSGDVMQVVMHMDEEYTGYFHIVALDPATGLKLSTLILRTDYVT